MTQCFDVDGILFDLDGTLLDTIPDLAEAANRMLHELRQPERSLEEITSFVGDGIRALVQRTLFEGRPTDAGLHESGYQAFLRHYAEVNGLATRPFPGVTETLQILLKRGYRLGCVTNKSEAFITPATDRLGLTGCFGSIVGGDTLPQRKPEPEPLLHACRQLGIPPKRALMVGDSPNDALAARRAGIPVLLLTHGYGTDLESLDSDGLLGNMPALLDHLSR
nr:phosphoglycolate phosphatase [uncultured Holophaga sp.]